MLKNESASKSLKGGFRRGFAFGVRSQLVAGTAVFVIYLTVGLGTWGWKGYLAAYLLGGSTLSYQLYRSYSSRRVVIGPIVGSFVMFIGTLLWLPIINLLMIPLGLIAILAVVVSCNEIKSGIMIGGMVAAGSVLLSILISVVMTVGSIFLPRSVVDIFELLLVGGGGPLLITLLSRTLPITAPILVGIYTAGWEGSEESRFLDT